jgi:hypothetical protein
MIVTSPDGETWTYRGSASSIMGVDPRLLGYYSGIYIHIASNGRVWESSNGTQWIENSDVVPFTNCRAGGFSHDGSKVVIVASAGGVIAIGDITAVNTPAITYDAGAIADIAGTTKDAGAITGSTDDVKDAGPLMSYPVEEIIDLGLVDGTVTGTINCQNIM